ncbi:MAG: thioredoxin [Candidatus Saccharimonadales bacterium]
MLKTITQDTFEKEVIESDRPVLVDLWAPWCNPCIAMEPTIKDLAADFDGKVDIAKLNIDENPDLAQSLDVMSIPTMLIFKDGKPVERIVGLTAKDKLAGILNAAIA